MEHKWQVIEPKILEIQFFWTLESTAQNLNPLQLTPDPWPLHPTGNIMPYVSSAQQYGMKYESSMPWDQ